MAGYVARRARNERIFEGICRERPGEANYGLSLLFFSRHFEETCRRKSAKGLSKQRPFFFKQTERKTKKTTETKEGNKTTKMKNKSQNQRETTIFHQ